MINFNSYNVSEDITYTNHLHMEILAGAYITPLPLSSSLWYKKILCTLLEEKRKHHAGYKPSVYNGVLPEDRLASW